jgi:hypothetical protein
VWGKKLAPNLTRPQVPNASKSWEGRPTVEPGRKILFALVEFEITHCRYLGMVHYSSHMVVLVSSSATLVSIWPPISGVVRRLTMVTLLVIFR